MNLDLIELRHLRSFLAVADHLNFHQAAEGLHLTQPALSRQIALVEAALERKLFTRDRRRVQLTAAGRYLQGRAPELLQGVERMLRETREAGEGRLGTLSLGYTEAAMASFLPALLRGVREQRSGLALQLTQGHSEQLAREVARGNLDAAFISLAPELPGLRSERVAQERVGMVLPDNHPLLGRRQLALKDLRAERFILFPYADNPAFYTDILGWCREAGFVPTLAEEATSRTLAVSQVAAGMGVTFLSEHLSHICGVGTVFKLLHKPRATMSFYVAERSGERNPAVLGLLELLRTG
ncbi:MAG: LysR family transcriptional regulator [Blastochloris sp.]|nr:LysR family transcriptional regulator [Blastochloris sp.]